ncbi:MAG: hypothetical protein J6Z08_00680 [Elusimicrobiales bacterium]|nr:hypothetical protein [Elusimicrobiales bacterium]
MPQINEKVMIEVLLSAEQAVKNLKKVSDAISGIGEQTNRQTETTAKKQEETAEKTAKIQQTAAKKTSSVIGKEMGLLLKGMFTLGAVIKGFQLINHFASMGADIRYMANAAGMAEGKFEKLGNAARKLGGSYASTGSTVRNLTLMLERLKFEAGGPLVEAARQYGLQFTKNGLPMNTEELMRSIARTMGEMGKAGNKTGQINLASLLGLDDATFRMMQDGEAMYLKRVREAEATDAAAKAASEKYVQAINGLQNATNKLLIELTKTLVPAITKLIEALPEKVKDANQIVNDISSGEAGKHFWRGTGYRLQDEALSAATNWQRGEQLQVESWNAIYKGINEFLQPITKSLMAVPVIVPAGSAGRGAIGAININQTFNGRAEPAQVARASEQGTRSGLAQSGISLAASASLGAGK